MRLLAIAILLSACRAPATEDAACRCVPENRSRLKLADGTPVDGATLLARLRRHAQMVAERRNPRDIKVLDDQLRFEVASLCQPCGEWVGDRLTMEELFPLDRLDDAQRAACMGLALRDGTTAWGRARPAACR